MNAPDPTDRLFLEHFDAGRRSFVVNAFLNEIRQPHAPDAPKEVTQAVRDRMARYLRDYGDTERNARYSELLAAVDAHPAEAERLATWAVMWEQLTPGEKERLKAQKAVETFPVWAASQDATPKQLALLQRLGHTGPVASKAEASRLIDALLNQERTQPKTAFGEAVMAAAGLRRAA